MPSNLSSDLKGKIGKNQILVLSDTLMSEFIRPPKIFKTHKVDKDFGVVYYYQLNGTENTIGMAYVRKATLFEKILWFM